MAEPLTIRRDPEADWFDRNPLLEQGELGLVTKDGRAVKAKMGPGYWNDLEYFIDPTTDSPQFVFGETPAGVVDGQNATFTTEFDFVPESVMVWLNGMLQQRPGDLNTSGARTILFSVSPHADDQIVTSYLRS